MALEMMKFRRGPGYSWLLNWILSGRTEFSYYGELEDGI
jgi:hypothetical protein